MYVHTFRWISKELIFLKGSMVLAPLISSFYGILIYLYLEKGTQHSMTHVHAMYNDYEMSIDFDGNILAGELPRKQTKLVEAWVLLHSDELRASWRAYRDDGELIKIRGLE